MALPETYYAVYEQGGFLPESSEWYGDLDRAKADSIEMAEDNPTQGYEVAEVMVRPLYQTKASVTLEKL